VSLAFRSPQNCELQVRTFVRSQLPVALSSNLRIIVCPSVLMLLGVLPACTQPALLLRQRRSTGWGSLRIDQIFAVARPTLTGSMQPLAADDPSAPRPQLPAAESSGLNGMAAGFAGPTDFGLASTSPAAGAGTAVSEATCDHRGRAWSSPPSIGAFER